MVKTGKALCLHGQILSPTKQNEEILYFFLILPYFLYFIILISCLQNYYISSDPPNHSAYFLHLPPILYIKPIFSQQKKAVTRLKSFCFGLPMPKIFFLFCPLMQRAAFFWAKTKSIFELS